MSGKSPLGNSKDAQSYEGTNIIVPVGGWNFIRSKVDPTASSKSNRNPVGSIWLNTVLQNVWMQTQPNVWTSIISGGGDVTSIAGTAAQISASSPTGAVTLSLPSAITTPGSLTTTATLTATAGNITATAGNFVSSAAGNGIVLNSGTASGTTTATLNGRSGQVTITTPSIAAGATFSFALTNSSITASTTQVLYGLTGGTTGAAVTIQSVTNSASTSTVVLMNGSGDTASTGSLVLTFLVLN